jgi:hypothetical protein
MTHRQFIAACKHADISDERVQRILWFVVSGAKTPTQSAAVLDTHAERCINLAYALRLVDHARITVSHDRLKSIHVRLKNGIVAAYNRDLRASRQD